LISLIIIGWKNLEIFAAGLGGVTPTKIYDRHTSSDENCLVGWIS
jgi:hypothetical protein